MACNRSENYYMSSVLLAQERKCSFDKVDLAEEDGFKLIADETPR